MVDVVSRRYLRDTCKSQPTLNINRGKIAEYCTRHADDRMVDIHSKVYTHNPCIMQLGWGFLINYALTICFRHKSDVVGGRVINFKARCQVHKVVKYRDRDSMRNNPPTAVIMGCSTTDSSELSERLAAKWVARAPHTCWKGPLVSC